jgi:hypothetical protein
VPNAPEEGLRTNPFFIDSYRRDPVELKGLEAREHTAQVPGEVREQREEAFRDARLPVLFCSPTMELAVDIAELNVVNMRNVPPTPANYAQLLAPPSPSCPPTSPATPTATTASTWRATWSTTAAGRRKPSEEVRRRGRRRLGTSRARSGASRQPSAKGNWIRLFSHLETGLFCYVIQ